MKSLFVLSLVLIVSNLAMSQRIEYESDSLQKKKVIKFDFLSPTTGNLTLGYEQYLKNFTSIEAKVGIIGLGRDFENYKASGAFLKVGPKFKLKPTYALDGTFATHVLRGGYIRPEIVLSYFKLEDEYSYYEDEKILGAAVIVNYGNQYVLGNTMTFDWSIGLGTSFSEDIQINEGYYFGYLAADGNFALAVSAGMTIGFMLK